MRGAAAIAVPREMKGRSILPREMTDTERLDYIEWFVNQNESLMIHTGQASGFSGCGLGLRPGALNRTLRQAIDQCSGDWPRDHNSETP
jgi:hypothetical protein